MSMKTKAGDRVGAISHTKDTTMYLFGYGVYQGEEVPPEDVQSILHAHNIANPKILLDSGKVVWGCECWWGPEDRIKQEETGFAAIENIDIDEARNKARQLT